MADYSNLKKKVDSNSTEFLDELQSFLEKDSTAPKSIEPTAKIDMDRELKKGLSVDEYNDLINKKNEIEKKQYKKALEAYDKQRQLETTKLMDKNKLSNLNINDVPDIDPSGTRSLHKTTNQASKEALDYAASQQRKGKLFSKLSSIFKSPIAKKIGTVAKIAGPVGAALGIASDVLASEDVGSEELEKKELEKAKQEQLRRSISKENDELANKPVTATDLLNITKPTIKQLGGEADINPKQATIMSGEQESPDMQNITEGLSRDEFERMMKKKLGY
jgi:hypothetical protein